MTTPTPKELRDRQAGWALLWFFSGMFIILGSAIFTIFHTDPKEIFPVYVIGLGIAIYGGILIERVPEDPL